MLDGEQLRRGLSRDLGFSPEERSENLRRAAHMARVLNENGIICLAALIAPDQHVREKVAELIGKDSYLTIHVDAPLEVCRARDPRGHYVAADEGSIPKLPGAGSAYQVPVNPDLVLNTSESSIDECVEKVLELLRDRKLIK